MVPERLIPHLRHHLLVCRPVLAQIAGTRRLWLSRTGKPMSGCAIHHRVTKVTLRVFGVAIPPHLFRDCVATSIAIDAPGKVGLIGPMLGHLAHRTAEAHYNQAASLDTGRAHQDIVKDLRRRLAAPRPDPARKTNR